MSEPVLSVLGKAGTVLLGAACPVQARWVLRGRQILAVHGSFRQCRSGHSRRGWVSRGNALHRMARQCKAGGVLFGASKHIPVRFGTAWPAVQIIVWRSVVRRGRAGQRKAGAVMSGWARRGGVDQCAAWRGRHCGACFGTAAYGMALPRWAEQGRQCAALLIRQSRAGYGWLLYSLTGHGRRSTVVTALSGASMSGSAT